MNGKIKTKFAALFAVALMITVCVVPVVGNDGTDAAPVSSTNGEVFEGYDITLFKVGDDYSDLIYRGAQPAGVAGATQSGSTGYWIDEDGKYITVGQVSGYEVDPDYYGLPLIQVVYGYVDAFNPITLSVKVEHGTAAPVKFENITQTNAGKSQGMFHIQMGEFDDSQPVGASTVLDLAPEEIAGDFKVSLTGTQGFATETVSKTVNAGTATVVSGTMKDAGDAAIKSVFDSEGNFVRGLKVKYKISNGTETTTNVDKDGKFQIYVVPGQYVEITSIGYYRGDTPVSNSYTFTPASYLYGTVDSSVLKEFKANEYTRTVTINTADSEVISGSATLGLNWYSQTYDSTDNEYVVAAATGTATQLNTAIEDGKIYVAYKAPEDASTSAVTYTYHLIVSLGNSGNFSFTTKSVDTDSNDSISTQISGANGTKDATEQNVTLKAKESTIVVKVLSKNGNPAQGVSIKFGWYSQKVNADDSSKYDVAKVTSSGSVKLVKSGSTTDEKGEIQLAYSVPTAVAGVTYYMYVSADVDNSNTTLAGYKFDVASLPDTSTGGNSISTMLNGKSASKAIVDIDDVTLNAKENTYKVSGNVIYKDAEVSYTNGINGEDEAVVDKDGKYSFYIIEGESTKITPDKTGINFVPQSYVTPSLSQSITVDFAKKADDVVSKPLKYQVKVEASTGVFSVDFDYKVNGVEFEQKISTIDQVATLTINAFPTDVIEVSASLNGYQVSAFDGYSAEAVYFNNIAYKIVDGDGNVIPNATFDVTYVVDGVTKIKQMTADENGFAYWASTDVNGTVYKDGYAQVPEKIPGTDDIFWRSILTPEGEQLSYCTYDLGDFYQVTPATVTIDYIAAYNVEEYIGVGGENIAGEYTYMTVVGGTVALKAPSIDGFEFVAWVVDGVVVSENADYTLKVDGNCHVGALYSAVHYEEPAEGLSMNVLVIGIVILIIGILAVAYGIISKKQ